MNKKYFNGISLDTFMHKHTIDQQTFLLIAIELCRSLEILHKQNIILGDLSTSSILINTDKEVSIFILRTTHNIANQKKQIYKAPEQSDRVQLSIDSSVDIYALGVIFYEMLTWKLEPLFEDTQDFFYDLLTKKIPLLTEVDHTIPLPISKIIEKMMAKNRQERYSDILSVQIDFIQCLNQLDETQSIQDFKLDTYRPFFTFNQTDFIYGREVQENKLAKIIASKRGSNVLISVSGESGIGKSSFVSKVLKHNKNRFSYILELKLEKYKQNVPYEILYGALRDLTKQIIAQDKRSLTAYKDELQKLLGDQAQILIDVIPEIEIIIGKQPEVKDINPSDKKARFDSMLFNFMKFFFHSDKPLCIYIDDLQWADQVTIQWIENIILNFHDLFVFVTYRIEDVDEDHLLKAMFKKLYSFDIYIEELSIHSLTKDDIKNLLYDTMQLEQSDEIARIILQKTGGNAFFVLQYIKQLQANETIYFDSQTLQWSCDLQNLTQLPISDNVFGVLNKRIDLLEPYVRDLLDIASCMGSSFSKNLLKSIYRCDELFLDALNKALEDEWILERSNKNETFYHFTHDKLQEAIYSKIDDVKLKNLHFEIGYFLFKNSQKLENRSLIACTNHLNIGFSSLDDPQILIDLNLRSSLHAKKSGDFANALLYVKKAMEFLPRKNFKQEDIFILKERGECEHLCHNSDQAVQYYELALQLSDSKIVKAQIYELLIKFYADISDFKKAYETGRTAAKLFDFNMPKSFMPPQFIFDFLKIKMQLRDRSIEQLINAKESQDEEFILLIKLAANTLQAAYQIRPELCVANAMKIVSLCLQKGLTKESVIAFTVFGVIFQGGILANHKLGFEYYKLSIDMLKRFHNTIQHAEVKFVSGYFATSWKQSSAKTEQLWEESYNNGLEIGDWFHTGCSAAGIVQSMFMRGVNVDTILEKIEHYLIVLKNIGTMEQYGSIQSIKHSILNLKGESASSISWDTDFFNEDMYVKSLQKYTSKHFAHYYYINKMTTLYFKNEYTRALKISLEGKKFATASKGMLHNTEHLFYEALVMAQLYKNETLATQIRYKMSIRKTKNKFYAWAKECTENFIVRAYLLEAELYRLAQNSTKAIEFYERAQGSAKIYTQVHLRAIANKLIIQTYEELGQKNAAKIYQKELTQNLAEWGIIEKRKNNLTDNTDFDIDTLIKASEIIVKEQRLSNLLKTLVQIIIQNSGAQHICLLLQEEDELFIEAEFSIDTNITKVMQNQPYMESSKIVHSIINYVLRTQESIVIDDLNEDRIFYNTKNTTKNIKSLLCAPLILKGEIKGIIYLENNLLPGVFTDDKVKLLQYLSGQIAISIENAVVYNNLEKTVKLRTKELEEVNKKLEKLSTTDPLTKISNRRHFETHIKDVWNLAIRKSVRTSIIMCDIDFFKKINDTYGHVMGDKVLKNVAGTIKRSLQRDTDLVARYGGEEFIIVLYDTDIDGARKLCEEIATTIKEESNFLIDGIRIEPFTISFGISCMIPNKEQRYELLLKASDEALYQAKENGRNCIVAKTLTPLS